MEVTMADAVRGLLWGVLMLGAALLVVEFVAAGFDTTYQLMPSEATYCETQQAPLPPPVPVRIWRELRARSRSAGHRRPRRGERRGRDLSAVGNHSARSAGALPGRLERRRREPPARDPGRRPFRRLRVPWPRQRGPLARALPRRWPGPRRGTGTQRTRLGIHRADDQYVLDEGQAMSRMFGIHAHGCRLPQPPGLAGTGPGRTN
jgi:hypothetical protein